jgi:hypothetical protein
MVTQLCDNIYVRSYYALCLRFWTNAINKIKDIPTGSSIYVHFALQSILPVEFTRNSGCPSLFSGQWVIVHIITCNSTRRPWTNITCVQYNIGQEYCAKLQLDISILSPKSMSLLPSLRIERPFLLDGGRNLARVNPAESDARLTPGLWHPLQIHDSATLHCTYAVGGEVTI